MSTAIRKVLEALSERLAAIPGWTVAIDRPADRPFTRNEGRAVNIRFISVDFSLFDGGTMLHRLEVDLDLYARPTALENLSTVQADMQAEAVAALWEDRFLGGRVQDIVPQSFEGDTTNLAEAGIAPLKIQILFLTPVGDFRTICGQAGNIF